MIKFDISEFLVYKWRYRIGYGLIAIGLITVLVFVGMYLPSGISNQEMQSVIKSSSLGFTSLTAPDITNLPYHLLQHASITIFDVSVLSIKLPSIILAFLSAIGIVLLLRRWFKPNVGILASLIAITTGQFLFIAQDGTPGILYLFWSVCLLLLANIISYQKRLKSVSVIIFCVATALSLYTPLSLYVLVALVIAAIFHPHLRYLIKKLPRAQLIISFILALVIVSPLVIALFKNPELWLTLLGIPSHWPDFGANFASLGAQYLGFSKPGGMTLMTPFFELGSMLIIAIGIYYVLNTRIIAKNYVISFWMLCLIPAIILNPNFTSITFLPLVLLLATGLNTLLAYWYNLFPRNPYARTGGIVPIVILVTVLVLSGASRFIYGYEYDPTIAPNFSQDLKLIPKDTKKLVVAVDELAFYEIVAVHNKNYSVSTAPIASDVNFLATSEADRTFTGYKIDRIITSSMKTNSDRFYLYTKITD
jgi:hypothetical protein